MRVRKKDIEHYVADVDGRQVNMKICVDCKKPKSEAMFNRGGSIYGKQARCRSCAKELRDANIIVREVSERKGEQLALDKLTPMQQCASTIRPVQQCSTVNVYNAPSENGDLSKAQVAEEIRKLRRKSFSLAEKAALEAAIILLTMNIESGALN
jgi:hypothetical protein